MQIKLNTSQCPEEPRHSVGVNLALHCSVFTAPSCPEAAADHVVGNALRNMQVADNHIFCRCSGTCRFEPELPIRCTVSLSTFDGMLLYHLLHERITANSGVFLRHYTGISSSCPLFGCDGLLRRCFSCSLCSRCVLIRMVTSLLAVNFSDGLNSFSLFTFAANASETERFRKGLSPMVVGISSFNFGVNIDG